MDAGGVEVAPEERICSSRSSSGCDSEKWETSEDEGGVTKSKSRVLPEGFLDPLPPQKPFKLPRLSGVGLRANKVICCGSSSRRESSISSNDPSTPMHLDSIEDFQFIDNHQSSRQSFQEFPRQAPPRNDGIRLIDEQGAPIRRRGRTTCTDIQCMPLGTRVYIEINENGVPCNIPESILLGSYMGVVARDSVLAPISFSDWRNRGMEPFKKRMLAEVESKFEFHANIRHWILQSIGVKWCNYKASLKSEHWDSRPIKEIKEAVPVGVDPTQWCQLVNQWAQPEDQKRAAKNIKNAKKQTCPHTMGRVSSVRRQQETSIQDRLQLWRINRMRKDGLWSSEDAKLRWAHACKMLAEEGLTPEDGNLEANERVFKAVMGPEYPGRVRTQGFGVTPTRYFPQSTTHPGNNSSSSAFARVARLEEQLRTLQKEMRQVMQHCQGHYPPSRSSDKMDNDQLLPE